MILSLLFIVISVSFANTVAKGELCDYFSLCGDNLRCSNRRCYSDQDLLLAKTNMNLTPQGPECDLFKWCSKGLKCKGQCVEKVSNKKDQQKEKAGNLQLAKKEQQKEDKNIPPQPNNKTMITPPPSQKDKKREMPAPQLTNSTANTTDQTSNTTSLAPKA